MTNLAPSRPGAEGPAKNPNEKKDGAEDKNKKPDGKAGDSTELKIISRANRTLPKVDKDELKAKPDADGKFRFNFQGQTWPDVLDWLAKVSNMSLDWQELPGDYLNLNVTKQEPTLPEVRDPGQSSSFDSRLHDVRTRRRVDDCESQKNQPGGSCRRQQAKHSMSSPRFSFVKVTIPVQNMMAEDAVKELKPLLSPFSTLTAIKTSNRIEAVDTVITLRESWRRFL